MGFSAQELAEEFQRLNEHLTGDADLAKSRQRLVDLAQAVIPGCRWAAITSWPHGRPPRTVARSADMSQRVDQIQYESGEGPCLSAAEESWTVWAGDLQDETRWPDFVDKTLADTPVRGVLSFHLSGLQERYALNLYSDRAGAFDQDAVASGALFASHAGVLMAHADAARQSADLQVALSTSRQIGSAVGMLMSTYQLPEDKAFEVLRRTSNELNRKVCDVAEQVTRTGRLPRD